MILIVSDVQELTLRIVKKDFKYRKLDVFTNCKILITSERIFSDKSNISFFFKSDSFAKASDNKSSFFCKPLSC